VSITFLLIQMGPKDKAFGRLLGSLANIKNRASAAHKAPALH